ncbi:MAG: hypothetical protein R3F11_22235 [Verrucomicrobiales bacterium]
MLRKRIPPPPRSSAPLTACAFSPDGSTVASASYDHPPPLGRSLRAEFLRLDEPLRQGHRLRLLPGRLHHHLVSSANLRLWDARSGKEFLRLEGHSAPLAAHFSPDGSTIALRLPRQSTPPLGRRSGKEFLRLQYSH